MRPARWSDADEGTQKFRVSSNHGGRQASFLHKSGGSVDVAQNRIEQFCALSETVFEVLPLGGFDEQRHVAERPGSHRARGILIDTVEDAGLTQVAIGRRKPAVDFLRSERSEHAEKRSPMLAQASVTSHHLIKISGRWFVPRQKRFEAF